MIGTNMLKVMQHNNAALAVLQIITILIYLQASVTLIFFWTTLQEDQSQQ